MSENRHVVDLDAQRKTPADLKPMDAVAHILAMIERIAGHRRALAANDDVRGIRVVLPEASTE